MKGNFPLQIENICEACFYGRKITSKRCFNVLFKRKASKMGGVPENVFTENIFWLKYLSMKYFENFEWSSFSVQVSESIFSERYFHKRCFQQKLFPQKIFTGFPQWKASKNKIRRKLQVCENKKEISLRCKAVEGFKENSNTWSLSALHLAMKTRVCKAEKIEKSGWEMLLY